VKMVHKNHTFKKHHAIIIILLIALIARLIFFFSYHEVWWDSASYLVTGKYIFSGGTTGLIEHIRPPLWPIVLGFIWYIGIPQIIGARILELILSLAVIYLSYKIAEKVFDQKTAIIASILVAFSPLFYFFGFRIYAGIPSLFLILLGYYFIITKRSSLLAGIILGLSFLIRYPNGIFIAIIALYFIFKKKNKSLLLFIIGALIPILLYLVSNKVLYGGFLTPIIMARWNINNVLGCNVLWHSPWYSYFIFIIRDNFLNIFAILGLIFALKNIKKNFLLIIFSTLLPLLYYLQLNCRDPRYILVYLPFLLILTSFGISHITKKLNNKNFHIIILIILIISGFLSISYYTENETTQNKIITDYHKFLQGKQTKAEVWSSNPMTALYTKEQTRKIYYPFYNSTRAKYFYYYLTNNSDNIEYVMLDNCGGGIICPTYDPECQEYTNYYIEYLNSTFKLEYNQQYGRCWHYVFNNPIFS